MSEYKFHKLNSQLKTYCYRWIPGKCKSFIFLYVYETSFDNIADFISSNALFIRLPIVFVQSSKKEGK